MDYEEMRNRALGQSQLAQMQSLWDQQRMNMAMGMLGGGTMTQYAEPVPAYKNQKLLLIKKG